MKNDQTLTFSAPAAIKSGIPPGRRTLLAAAAALAWRPCTGAERSGGRLPQPSGHRDHGLCRWQRPDAVLRIVGEKLAARWKQSVTVDNRPGGGGFVAIEAARRASPTAIRCCNWTANMSRPCPISTRSAISFRWSTSTPWPRYSSPFFVAVPTNSPWKNMGDLIKAAKAEPGKVSYGSWGVGSPGHLGANGWIT